MDLDYFKKNILKISDILWKEYSEIWTISFPYFKKYENIKFDFNIKKDSSLYLHIPFCLSKCSYCSYYWNNDIYKYWSWKYTDLLIKEINIFFENKFYWEKIYLSSMLIWWWTPTLLKTEDIDRLMDNLYNYFYIDKSSQLTIESTPWLLDENKIIMLKNKWFNRISIWVQTFNEGYLSEQNRLQKNLSVYNAFKILRKNKFKSINIDLIYWLSENDTIHNFLEDNLKHLLKLNPDSIDIFPNQNLLWNKNISKKMNEDVKIISSYINKIFWKDKSFVQLDVWKKWFEYNYEDFPYNRSKYLFDRRIKLKNVYAFWLWWQWQFKDLLWNMIDYRLKAKTLKSYEDLINKKYDFYKFRKLDYKTLIKFYFIRNLRVWINKDILFQIFNSTRDKIFIKYILWNIYEYIKYNSWYIYLDNEKISLKYHKNQNIAYFLFSIDKVYEEMDRKKLYNLLNQKINNGI